VPGTGTILTGPGRAWTVLFRAVPGLAHRVSAKWPSIGAVVRLRPTLESRIYVLTTAGTLDRAPNAMLQLASLIMLGFVWEQEY
jgi:hypothetical protein